MASSRLQQILARAGVASRRAAEGLIRAGRVAVNGVVVTELGSRADPDVDVVTLDGQPVGPAQEPATLMMHKPAQVVTTLEDPQGRETVAALVGEEPYRFVPVGRLDYHTEGLLFMTTDGELVNRLLHPSHHVPKVYQVKVRGAVGDGVLARLQDGVALEDGPTRPAVVEVLERGDRHTWLEVVVTEGRNRLVRRMMEAVGHPALRVVRTEMATLPLGDLKPGQFRYLDPTELSAVYRTAGLDVPRVAGRAFEAAGVVFGKARRGKGRLPGQAEASTWVVEGDDSSVGERRPRPRSGPRRSSRSDGERIPPGRARARGRSTSARGGSASARGRSTSARGGSTSARGRSTSARGAPRGRSRPPRSPGGGRGSRPRGSR